jgi:sulfur carrier protein ThiS
VDDDLVGSYLYGDDKMEVSESHNRAPRLFAAVPQVSVTVNKREQELRLPEGATVAVLLDALELYPDANIVLRQKTPVPLTETLLEGDVLRVIKVASGG